MLTRCYRCDARYDPTIEWVYGWCDKDSTTDRFEARGSIKLGDCPICRKPPLPDPTAVASGKRKP